MEYLRKEHQDDHKFHLNTTQFFNEQQKIFMYMFQNKNCNGKKENQLTATLIKTYPFDRCVIHKNVLKTSSLKSKILVLTKIKKKSLILNISETVNRECFAANSLASLLFIPFINEHLYLKKLTMILRASSRFVL